MAAAGSICRSIFCGLKYLITTAPYGGVVDGGIISEFLEIYVPGSHVDAVVDPCSDDSGITAIYSHTFQSSILSIGLVVDIAVSYIKAFYSVLGEYLDYILRARVTAESVILCHIHVIEIIPLQHWIP